jgi:hypothetical protein
MAVAGVSSPMRRLLGSTAAGLLALAVSVSACSGSRADCSPDCAPATTAGSNPTTAAVLAVPDLPDRGGCGDVFFYAVSADARAAVVVRSEAGLLGTLPGRRQPTDPLQARYDLPDPALHVEVQVGEAVSQPFCNDVISGDYRLDVTRPAVAGTVDLDIAAGDCPSTGTASLHDVVVDSGGRRLSVPDMTITATGIGCFAG